MVRAEAAVRSMPIRSKFGRATAALMEQASISPLWWVVVPQAVLLVALSSYLVLGGLIFQYLDDELRTVPFHELILFEFGTLATIGWGNIYPHALNSQIFVCGFALLGIPLFMLCISCAVKYVAKIYWYFLYSLGFIAADAKLPATSILFLFGLTFCFAAVMIEHSGTKYSIDDVYYSFVSFTTVGFGDKAPIVSSYASLALHVCFLSWGIVLTTSLFSWLHDVVRKVSASPSFWRLVEVHFVGRRFRGARDVTVSLGGQRLTVSKLVATVAQEFDASPREIRAMLLNLDELISSSTPKQPELAPLVKDIEDFDCYE